MERQSFVSEIEDDDEEIIFNQESKTTRQQQLALDSDRTKEGQEINPLKSSLIS